jgi:hypothetical protein
LKFSLLPPQKKRIVVIAKPILLHPMKLPPTANRSYGASRTGPAREIFPAQVINTIHPESNKLIRPGKPNSPTTIRIP